MRPTSLTTARDFIVPKVMICPTASRPYFSRTYSITSPRRSKQKSTSMSGIDTRSGIQEALEEQVELDRAEVRDARAVGDDRAGGRAAARSDRDAAVARPLDEVGDDQEVAGVAKLRDDAELVVDPLA